MTDHPRTAHAACLPAYIPLSEKHAFLEGEGDRTLDQWKKVHQEFFTEELKTVGKPFSDAIELVCEEFEVVYQIPVDGGKRR